jgi:hypothetical protein
MPRKVFTAGEVLAATDVNTYLSNEVTLTSSTASSLTVTASDRYKTLVFNSAGSAIITFGTATAFEPGERVDIVREGAGTVTITRDGTAISLAGAGTAGTAYAVADRYAAASVLCVATNSYRVIGNVTAV